MAFLEVKVNFFEISVKVFKIWLGLIKIKLFQIGQFYFSGVPSFDHTQLLTIKVIFFANHGDSFTFLLSHFIKTPQNQTLDYFLLSSNTFKKSTSSSFSRSGALFLKNQNQPHLLSKLTTEIKKHSTPPPFIYSLTPLQNKYIS